MICLLLSPILLTATRRERKKLCGKCYTGFMNVLRLMCLCAGSFWGRAPHEQCNQTQMITAKDTVAWIDGDVDYFCHCMLLCTLLIVLFAFFSRRFFFLLLGKCGTLGESKRVSERTVHGFDAHNLAHGCIKR